MPTAPSARATYHHGDLRRSLIEAAESLLAERGIDAFSLREVARRAGVSPAAPAHHFGDGAGLLAAVSTLGFQELAQSLIDGQRRAGRDPRARLVGQGVGYVRFALRQPGRFRLMFRPGKLREDEALVVAATAAFGQLENGIRALCGIVPAAPLDAPARAALLAMWSIVHGFAHLAIAGRFGPMTGGAELEPWIARTLPGVLRTAIDGVGANCGARRLRVHHSNRTSK
jgi:AcrR family transcriptional regulator